MPQILSTKEQIRAIMKNFHIVTGMQAHTFAALAEVLQFAAAKVERTEPGRARLYNTTAADIADFDEFINSLEGE